MPIKVVAFDGDDTLWHNEAHFNLTQNQLRELLLRHAPGADVDRRLFATEMANLGLYGYGIKSFTLSMLETAIEVTEGQIPASDLKVILDWGKRMLQEPTELLEGVREALVEVSRRHAVLLITKGDLFDQEGKLARSGLGELFQGVEILSEKTQESYQQVLVRRGIAPGEFVMVGNSLRSDVVPIVKLGATAVHIPYPLTWRHEHVDEAALPAEGWYRLERIHELPGLLGVLDRRMPGPEMQELQSRPDRKKNKKKNKRASGPLSIG
jgi:putative hydrolase of the HAD superfamily